MKLEKKIYMKIHYGFIKETNIRLKKENNKA